MTVEERLAALEQKTQDITRTVYVDPASGTPVPGLQINARVGVFTNFWLNQPIGQGAALSVGTNIDRYAGYFEIDDESCLDHPSVAVFASVVPESKTGQPHIAIQGQAGNAPSNYSLYLTVGDKTFAFRGEGLELLGNVASFLIGKAITGVFQKRQLWP